MIEHDAKTTYRTDAMQRFIIAIVFLSFPMPILAADFCQRQAYDAEVPAGLYGSYEIIGRDPSTGKLYSGRIGIDDGKSHYSVTRTINSQPMKGQAWIEACSAEKIPYLFVRYDSEPKLKFVCSFAMDGDNYYRITCRTGRDGKNWHGLEAWFQNP